MEDLISKFYREWGNFPGPARLIRKDRMVLAANKHAEKAGFGIETICAKIGSPESHKGCLANKTIVSKTGQGDIISGKMARYWLPVDGEDDVFVHLSVRLEDIVNDIL